MSEPHTYSGDGTRHTNEVIRQYTLRAIRDMDEHRLLVQCARVFTQGATKNLAARVHGLLHTMPDEAKKAGYPSMRSSAKACGVSVEWIFKRRTRMSMPLIRGDRSGVGGKWHFAEGWRVPLDEKAI